MQHSATVQGIKKMYEKNHEKNGENKKNENVTHSSRFFVMIYEFLNSEIESNQKKNEKSTFKRLYCFCCCCCCKFNYLVVPVVCLFKTIIFD